MAGRGVRFLVEALSGIPACGDSNKGTSRALRRTSPPTEAGGFIVAGLIFLMIFPCAICGCHRDTEKEKIEKTLTAVRAAAENRDFGGVLNQLSKTYKDEQGNDYDAIRSLVLFYFFRHQSITVIMSDLETDIRGSEADARFQAILSGRTGSVNILPEALGAYRFTVKLAAESGEWKVTSAKWERFGDGRLAGKGTLNGAPSISRTAGVLF